MMQRKLNERKDRDVRRRKGEATRGKRLEEKEVEGKDGRKRKESIRSDARRRSEVVRRGCDGVCGGRGVRRCPNVCEWSLLVTAPPPVWGRGGGVECLCYVCIIRLPPTTTPHP